MFVREGKIEGESKRMEKSLESEREIEKEGDGKDSERECVFE